jgi:uncharacterized protein YjbI with pentapeptide repeats
MKKILLAILPLFSLITQMALAYNKATFEYVKKYKKLPGETLADRDLSCAKFAGFDLSNAKLSGADLSGADLSGANLYGADLSKSKCGSYVGADMRNANLTNCDANHANFSRANLSYANLSGMKASRAIFEDSILDDAVLYNVILDYSILTGASCKRADMGNIKINYSDLRNVNFENANLSKAVIQGPTKITTMIQAILGTGKFLSREEFETINFNGADVLGAAFLTVPRGISMSGAIGAASISCCYG